MTRFTTLQARKITDDALSSLWALFTRPKPDGGAWGDTGDSDTEEEYGRQLAHTPGKMGEVCKIALDTPGITATEAAALDRYIALEAEAALQRYRMR